MLFFKFILYVYVINAVVLLISVQYKLKCPYEEPACKSHRLPRVLLGSIVLGWLG